MKRIFVNLLILVVMVSCDEDVNTLKNIDGTWNISVVRFTDAAGNVSESSFGDFTISFDACKNKANNQFNCGGTASLDDQSYLMKYRINDDAIFFDFEFEAMNETEKFLDEVFLVGANFEIIELDDSRLLLKKDGCKDNSSPSQCEFIEIEAYR